MYVVDQAISTHFVLRQRDGAPLLKHLSSSEGLVEFSWKYEVPRSATELHFVVLTGSATL